MAEACDICIKEETLKYMLERIEKGETSTKEIIKIVSDIKDGHQDTKYSLLTIKNTQATMESTEKENKAAQAIRDKENKELFMAGFKAIEDKRVADELKIVHEKEEAKKLKDIADAETLKEKRNIRRSIYVAIAILAANTIIGLLVKYFPKGIGL